MQSEAEKLESQPKNDALDAIIEEKEQELRELDEDVKHAKAFFTDAKTRAKIVRALDQIVAEWKKRKSKCLSALTLLDSASDGTISLKKCLKGDGQMVIESDEATVKEKVRWSFFKIVF